jgi:trigger factor
MFADVRRGKTIAAAVEAATVSDTEGNVIETSEFFGTRDLQDADDPEDDETDEADASSEEPSGDTE